MTNYEKYSQEIMEIVADGHSVAVTKSSKPISCGDIDCDDCILCDHSGFCGKYRREWLLSEYGVKASELPVDTKVICWEDINEKHNRYFSKFEDGLMYTFADGSTSWSHNSESHWPFMTLEDGTPVIAD